MAHPPAGVGCKANAYRGIEVVDGVQQAQVAFLDQVQQGDAAAGVLARDADHKPQVRRDHRFTRLRPAGNQLL